MNNFSFNLFNQIIFNFFKDMTWSQIMRCIDFCLMFYIIFHSIFAIVSMSVSLVEYLSILPAGFEDSVLQMNRGNPDNYGFINPGTPNTPGTPGGSPGGFPPGVPGSHHTNVHIIHEDGS
jgi:hypothetical protein